MGRLGLSKRSDNGDDDGNRRALFSSRSKDKSPGPAANPYAQPAPPDPYTEAKMKAGVMRGGPQDNGNKGYSGAPAPKYQQSMPDGKYGSNAGYGPNRPGDQAAYGTDRYGRGGPTDGGSRFGAGGYGGLGSADPNAADDNRDALFGGARERAQAQSLNNANRPPPHSSQPGMPPGDEAANGGNATYGTYGTYQERQLTAEEEEEEEVQAAKDDIRDMKRQDISSTRNALRAAEQAEETGRGTLARLGAQGESIHNTEKNLDLAANQNRIAEDKARELRRVNRSMFSAVSVGNPFTSEKRRQAREDAILDRHQQERIQREETRLAAYRADQRMQSTFKDISKQGDGTSKSKPNLAERSKYQFEADSEDEGMENEIDSNLDALHGAAGRLNALAKATGREVEAQNKQLEVLSGKSSEVDDQLHLNSERMGRIR